nr:hypothetical protein [Tanacetum cinerariifolium]
MISCLQWRLKARYQSLVVVHHGMARNLMRLAFLMDLWDSFATVCVLCSLRSCEACASCDYVLIILLAEWLLFGKTVIVIMMYKDSLSYKRSPLVIAEDLFCATYNILAELRPELPGHDDTIKDDPAVLPRRGPTPCCLLKKINSLKNWNDQFFWIDASICPIFVPWYTGASVLKDPLSSDNRVNVELLALLDHHCTIIRWYPKIFLYLDGLRRSFDDVYVRPTLLKDDECDIGLLDFVKSANPFKVKTGEMTLAEGEFPLNDETVNINVSLSADIIQIVEHTIMDELKEHAGKKKIKVIFDDLPVKRLRDDAGVAPKAVLVTCGKSSASLRRLELQIGAQGVRVEPHVGVEDIATASVRGVGMYGNDIEASTSVPGEWSVTNGALVDDPALCQNLLDQITPPGYWRDAEIVALKTRLKKAEGEAAKFVALRSRVFELEVGWLLSLRRHIIKLGADCERLRNEVVGEAKLREEFKSFQDATERRFKSGLKIVRRWVVGHSFRLAMYKCARSVEYHFALVKIEMKYVAAVFEFENVSFPLLDELEGLKDSLLALIMSALTLKDDQRDTDTTPEFCRFQPSLDQVTMPVYFESGSIDRKMLLSYAILAIRKSAARRRLCPHPSSTLGEGSSSVPPHGSSLGVADYQVSTLVLSGGGGFTTQPHVVPAHDDLFDTYVLDGFGGV